MNAYRQRMFEEMQLRRLSPRTPATYVAAVARLCRHCGKAPPEIGREELRRYFLYLTNERKVSGSRL